MMWIPESEEHSVHSDLKHQSKRLILRGTPSSSASIAEHKAHLGLISSEGYSLQTITSMQSWD